MRHAHAEPHHDGSERYVGVTGGAGGGRVRLGDRVPVRLRVPAGYDERGVWVRYVVDGEPRIVAALRDDDGGGRVGGARWYTAEVEVHNPVAGYRFLVATPRGYVWVTGRGVRRRDVPDAGDFRLSAHDPGPDWLVDAVGYQVFPDRFARSAGADGRAVPAWATAVPWDAEPAVSGAATGRELFGGDLAGIEQHLDHLVHLGVTLLYMTPFFPARSVHRYDATSFDEVDPLLGGDEALVSLVRAAHARGVRVMGDLTTNHTGVGHGWFQRALSDPSSAERSFYYWNDTGPGYVGWLGHASLPKLNYGSDELLARMAGRPDSVAARWLREPFALDGWRIDVANMTGRYAAQDDTVRVARALRETVVAARPDGALVGEHFHDFTADLTGDGWHAVMNYAAFTRPVWSWLGAPDGPGEPGFPVAPPQTSGRAMVGAMREFAAGVAWPTRLRQWNMLGSHDTPRIRSVIGDDALVEVALGLLVTQPGTPIVFAGDEIGARGTTGEHARTAMPWDAAGGGDPSRWDERILATYRELLGLRHSLEALRRGGLRWLVVARDAVAYVRETPDDAVLVLAARAPWRGAEVPVSELPGAGGARNVYGGAPLERDRGRHPGRGGGAGTGTVRLPGTGPMLQVWHLPRP